MLNSKEAYEESGRKSARARHNRDESLARFHWEWFQKAKALEKKEDRGLAESYWTEAYKEESWACKVGR